MNSPRSFLSAVSLFRMLHDMESECGGLDPMNAYLISASRIGSSVGAAN